MPEIFDWEERAPFLKLDEVKDCDIVVFNSEGRYVDDKWGTHRLQMDIILPNKEVRRVTVNKTSLRLLNNKFRREGSTETGNQLPVLSCWKE